MAMTNNQLDLVEFIAKNDMRGARKAARAVLVEDESKKNHYEVTRLKKLLDPALNPELTQLPSHVKGLLEVEDVSESFIIGRYWVSGREDILFDKISKMREVCDRLADLRIRRSNSVMLHGVSGTGKTSFGRYVAAMFDLPFYYINFSNLIDSHLGATSKNVASVFDYVKYEPCVLMLDEIDTIARKRGPSDRGADSEINRITVTLMQEFDRLMNHQIVIAATNRLNVIDEALIRRFSMVHEVEPPKDAFEAASVIRCFLDDVGIAYDEDELIAFCDWNTGKTQSWLIGKAVEYVVESVNKERDA